MPVTLTELDLDDIDSLGIDAAIVAYPHGAAAPTDAALRAAGVKVVDLSADFRLRDMDTYERWYGEHGAPELFGTGVYGLSEMYREELRGADLVATPGCYPTATVLGLAPLAEKGLLGEVFVSAFQGTSGYGRSSDDLVHYSSMTENAFPYKTEGHRHRPEIEQELAALGSPAPVTFVPHLVPLDQGEMATCFATLGEPTSREAIVALYAERYADEPFVHLLDGPPNLRALRDTNECHVYVTVEERGRVMAFSAIDNIWKGASVPGHPEPEPDAGARRDGGTRMSADVDGFFRSRWVDAPAGVEEHDPSRLAPGFRAGGAHVGLKNGGATDVGLLVCDAEEVSSALVLTRNASAAAPIRVCRDVVDQAHVRAAVINSGNANAETGEKGFADALAMSERAADALGLETAQVAVAETGVIGVPMPMSTVLPGIEAAAKSLSADGGAVFTEAISTTDRWSKHCTLTLDGVTLSAQAKGAGMIEPNMATMLCFVQTDAVVDDPDAALHRAVDTSFNRITVDGQMSTNDTVLLQASGASGKPLPDGLLDAVLLQLAIEVVRDGEGAKRAAPDRGDRRRRPGRGRAGRPRDRQLEPGEDRALRPRPQLGSDRPGRRRGARRRRDGRVRCRDDRRRRARRADVPEANIALRLPRGSARAHVYFSDLGHEYVTLNAEYTT